MFNQQTFYPIDVHQSIQSTNSKDPGSCNVVHLLKYEVVAQAAISCDFAVHALLSRISCLDGVFFLIKYMLQGLVFY